MKKVKNAVQYYATLLLKKPVYRPFPLTNEMKKLARYVGMNHLKGGVRR